MCESCAAELGRAIGQVAGKDYDDTLEALHAAEQVVADREGEIVLLRNALESGFAELAAAWTPKTAAKTPPKKKEVTPDGNAAE